MLTINESKTFTDYKAELADRELGRSTVRE